METETPFELWWLFWAAVVVLAAASFVLALTVPAPAGAGIAVGALASAALLLWAVVFRLVFWCIGRIAGRSLRLAVLVAVTLAFLLAREGALGERAAGWCGFALQTGGSTLESSTQRTFPTYVPPGFGQVVPACHVEAPAGAPASDAARGFAATLARTCAAPAGPALTVSYQLEAADAWCYLPLWKRASWPYRVRVTIGAPARSSAVIEGRVDLRRYGPYACRSFNQELGGLVAQAAHDEAERLLTALRARSAPRR